MASVPVEAWDFVFEGDTQCHGTRTTEIDNALMAFLEDAQPEEAEDERLGYVIRSLEAVIDPNLGGNNFGVPQLGNYEDCEDSGLESTSSEDGYDCSGFCVEDPFDWIEMEMVSNSAGDEVDNWYMETCMDEIEIVNQFGANNPSIYYGDASVEHAYSPLWQEDARYY